MDDEGDLVDPQDWAETVAQELAELHGIGLMADHWRVLRFMRQAYEDRQVAPDARHVMRHLDTYYPGAGRKRLFDLFPYGYVQQACKVAGMKRPRAWSTG